ncbi:hypothetical protein J4462_04420 [Candidatus Pacearchaeota archaeon]|nr:hypothetical protein [Candidatus Pacearchaeota archaeon]
MSEQEDNLYEERGRKIHPEVGRTIGELEVAVVGKDYKWTEPKPATYFIHPIETAVNEIAQSAKDPSETTRVLVPRIETYVNDIQHVAGPNYRCDLLDEPRVDMWRRRSLLAAGIAGAGLLTLAANGLANFSYYLQMGTPLPPNELGLMLDGNLLDKIPNFFSSIGREEPPLDLSHPLLGKTMAYAATNAAAVLTIPLTASILIRKKYREYVRDKLDERRQTVRGIEIPIMTDTLSAEISSRFFPEET